MDHMSAKLGRLRSQTSPFDMLVSESPELRALVNATGRLTSEQQEAREWIKELIKEKPKCKVAEYDYGALIQDTGTYYFERDGEPTKTKVLDKHLGVLISGSAELCEEQSIPGCVPAYRPTRLLRAGDFFGDFSIVDATLSRTVSQPGESWRMYAGRRSLIIAADVEDHHLDKFRDEYDDEIKPHVILNNTHDKQTRVAFFRESSLFAKHHNFFRYLVHQGWRRSITYRLGLNSYNFLRLLWFRRMVDAKVDEIWKQAEESGKPYAPRVNKTHLVPIFVDALYDALNRPLTGDLVFAASHGDLSEKFLKALGGIRGVNREKVWVAADPSNPNSCPFYYPVDVSNYIVTATCLLDDAIPKIRKKNKKGEPTKLSDLAVDNLSISRADKKPKVHKPAIQMAKTSAEHMKESAPALDTDETIASMNNRPRRFYIDLFKEAFNIFRKEHPDYPFRVTCLDEAGVTGRMLILKFERNDDA
jgi:hypothetical protein